MMAQSDPFSDWRDKLQKVSNWVKNQDTKPQVMNWKPEPNEEQKRQIEKESTKPLAKRRPLGSKAPAKKKAAAKATARKRQ
jgi:hypothetical protein